MAKLIDLNGLQYFKEQENAMVAADYSATKTYAVGDYAYYNGVLKRCITAITTAEAYTAAHWTNAVLAGDVSELKTVVGIIDTSGLTYTSNSYIGANGTITQNSNFKYSSAIPIGMGEWYFTLLTRKSGSSSSTFRIHGYDSNGNWVEQITYFITNRDSANIKYVFIVSNNNIKSIKISCNKDEIISSFYRYCPINVVEDDLEPGSLAIATGGYSSPSKNYGASRLVHTFEVCGNSSILCHFSDSLENTKNQHVFFLNANNELISYWSTGNYVCNNFCFVTPNNTKYIRICLTPSSATYDNLYKGTVTLSSADCKIEKCYNPNILSSDNYSLRFAYEIAKGCIGSGRLLLPPNYKQKGRKIPLIVHIHGSGSMTGWDSELGISTLGGDYQPFFTYLSNEGFAVFDCYPWSSKETIATDVYSPIAVEVSKMAYIKGIEYCCSRFNIDINKVSIIAKSQGGHLAHWFSSQTRTPIKAICMMNPASGVSKNNLFYNSDVRTAITKYVDFDGTTTEINAFISSGSTSNSDVLSFVQKNKGKIKSLTPYCQGVVNYDLDTYYTDFMASKLNAAPQWILDDGIEALPEGASNPYAVTSRDDLIKTSCVPIKFWCAFDDEAASQYTTYAVYRWLLNGNSDATFRQMPDGTGGHYSTDTSPDALTNSGTTALGIAYTDIPVAYIEAVEFIRLKGGD